MSTERCLIHNTPLKYDSRSGFNLCSHCERENEPVGICDTDHYNGRHRKYDSCMNWREQPAQGEPSLTPFEAILPENAEPKLDDRIEPASPPAPAGGAREFLASRGLADLSLYWPTGKPIPKIDYESGEAQPTLIQLMDEHADERVRQAQEGQCAECARAESLRERAEAEAAELRQKLADKEKFGAEIYQQCNKALSDFNVPLLAVESTEDECFTSKRIRWLGEARERAERALRELEPYLRHRSEECGLFEPSLCKCGLAALKSSQAEK